MKLLPLNRFALTIGASRPWSEGYDSLARRVSSSSSSSRNAPRTINLDPEHQSFNQDEPVVYDLVSDDDIEEDPEEDTSTVPSVFNQEEEIEQPISITRQMTDAFFNTRLASLDKLKEVVDQRVKLLQTARVSLHDLARVSSRLDMIDFTIYADKPKNPFYKYGYRLRWLRRRHGSMQRMRRGVNHMKRTLKRNEDTIGPRIQTKAYEFVSDVNEVASWTGSECMGDLYQMLKIHGDGQAAFNYLFEAEERALKIADHLKE